MKCYYIEYVMHNSPPGRSYCYYRIIKFSFTLAPKHNNDSMSNIKRKMCIVRHILYEQCSSNMYDVLIVRYAMYGVICTSYNLLK